ncbi:MAG: methyl-accepting chemotaxis protein [Methanoregula sp.]|nr:MAG: methyl-accepting chemotaxis protein [Methanoregula sp.]
MPETKAHSNIFKVIVLTIILPIIGLGFLGVTTEGWTWLEIPFHSVLEAMGVFAGLFLAWIFISGKEDKENGGYYTWIAAALIGMAILDGFHASVTPGNLFVWFHTIAVLAGGSLFLVALGVIRSDQGRGNTTAPVIAGVVVVLIGLYSIIAPDSVPVVMVGGVFTLTGIIMNVIAGILFLCAGFWFLSRYRQNGQLVELFFGSFCLLNGVAAAVFPLSAPWLASWWLWHFLRLAAYLVLLGYVYYVFQQTSRKLLESSKIILRKLELEKTMEELNGAIQVLASSSSEILATTTQIAAGAAETASAIGETTSTIEEVKQTVDLASQKANNVAEGSRQASAIAQSGQKAVDNVVSSMHRVQEQMESIADNVVQLAEKSQAIGEIIVTVNDIAEQSNILAVNASIEAAKAGEQGKGFGVVAQEIRTLAEQSKEATAQVRTILTDIQRGVSASVMATEQGNRTVAESMKQSTEAGESIRVLAGTVAESATAATQIAASSQQQLVGMNQIVQSMENIKQASQQNLKGTQQAETAAKNLHDLGQKLKQIADRYRL